jgi:hypothetical protein
MERGQHNIDTHKDIIHRVLFLAILLKGVAVSFLAIRRTFAIGSHV